MLAQINSDTTCCCPRRGAWIPRGAVGLRLACPQAVFVLERRHRLNRVGAAERLNASLGHAEVLDLAFPDQLLDSARHVLDSTG